MQSDFAIFDRKGTKIYEILAIWNEKIFTNAASFISFDSKLEVDKGLYLAAFHLNDQIDDGGDEEGTQHHTTPFEHTHATLLEGIGHEMGDIAEEYHGEDYPIAGDNLLEEFGVEIDGYLRKHCPRGLEGGVAEENPTESHEMKGQEDGEEPAQACAAIVLVVTEHMFAQPLVEGQRHTMHAAPSHEVKTGTVPQSTQQHGDDQVDILTHLALTVATQGDIDIVAYPRRE